MFSTKVEMQDQKAEIKQQTMLVNAAFHQLWEMDKKLLIPLGLGVYFWLRSNAGVIDSALACAGATYALDFSFTERQHYAANFKRELNKLLNLYQVHAIREGVKVTHDDIFLGALETLAPFISVTEALFPVNFRQANTETISAKFFNILSQPPHQITLLNILNKKPSSSGFFSTIASFFSTTTSRNYHNVTIQSPSFYQQGLMSIKSKLYGFQSLEQLTQSETSLTEVVRKVL